MLSDSHKTKDLRKVSADMDIRAQVEWATGMGKGSIYTLFYEDEFRSACSSVYA